MPSKKSSPPLPPLFHPLENTRANTLLNELFLRESFNFIRWKNSTSPRGFFRCSPLPPLPLFLKVPLTWLGKPRWGKIFPFNGHSFKLRRPTVEKSDQRFSSSARSTLSANVQASLMFSHGIIFLFLFPSLFIFLSHSVCLFVCLPPLSTLIPISWPQVLISTYVLVTSKKRELHSDSHEYLTSVSEAQYFSLFDRQNFTGERLPGCCCWKHPCWKV